MEWRPKISRHQKVAYTGTAGTIATAIKTDVFEVRVVCTSDAYIAVGASPTATTDDMYMPANEVEYFRIRPGEKISAIQDSAGGNLHVTELVK